MAKKLFDTQTGIPKQEPLDLSMFGNKEEFDLSMFKKKEESVSPEPESQSSIDPIELRYTDYKLKLDNLSIDKPKPFGVTDQISVDFNDLAAKVEASKPIKNQFSDYALGVPQEMNNILANTFEWIGKRTQDLDQILGGIPGYVIAKAQTGNPDAQFRAALQEQYLKEKNPAKKEALGNKINEFKNEQNPFLEVSNIYRNAANNLPELPENIAGQAIKGAVDVVPLVASLMYTPEITLPSILGTAFKVPKFTTLEAVKGFYKGATTEGTVGDKIKNSLVETAYGAGTGTFLHGLGVTSQQVGKLVGDATKSAVLKGSTAALANGLGFSAYDAGTQFYQTGEVDTKQMIASGITGAILGIPEVASIAYEKSVSKFFSSPKSAVESVASMKIDPIKLREESNRLGEEAAKAEGEQRNDILANKNMVDSILDINAAYDDIVKNADVYHEMVNKSDLPDARKKELNEKIDYSVELDRKFQSETDANILKSRETTEPVEPSMSILDETRNVFKDIELGNPISNKRLTEASDNLIQEYTRLNSEKHSPNRSNTSTEINSVLGFLEKKMQDVEKEFDVQREKRILGDFKGEKTESEPKVSPEKDNASTTSPERPTHEIQYEEAMSKKDPETIAKMPTFKGKKFSLATIKPNGDISNVYVRSEGQSHKTYMTPEDAKAYEEGSLSLGYWSPESKTFMEAPQRGREFGKKVMDIAASKVEEPKIETNAPEKQTTEKVDVEIPSTDSQKMGERNQGQEPTGEGQKADAEKAPEKVEYFPKEEKPATSGFGGIVNVFRNKRDKFKPISIKQVWNKYMTASRGAPKSVHEAWVGTRGKIAARQYDIQNSVKDKIKEISKAYGREITDADLKEINTALEQMGPDKASQDAFFSTVSNKIPDAARPALEGMRAQIDAYSKELMKLDFIGSGLEGKIDANTGYYLTRSYKKHTDRRWTWDTVPNEIKERAAEKVAELYPDMTPDQVRGFVKSLVESKDVTSLVVKQGQSLADIDKASLKKRSVFLTDNPEIRELLGQNENPFYNYAVSLTRMAEMIERGKMIEGFISEGVQNGWLSEKQSFDKNHIAQIPYNKDRFAGKPGTKPLSDFYTTPEIADAVGTYFESSKIDSKVMRLYMNAVTGVKLAKTAMSIKGTVRNFKSNITNAIANGNWNLHEITPFFNEKRKDYRGFIRELKEQGIIGDSANAGELIRNLEDLSKKVGGIESTDATFLETAKSKTIDKLVWTYGMADDVWKVWRYASEYSRYKKAYEAKGIPDAEQAAKKKATEILHATSTYYSELPLFIQKFRKIPVAQTFISFPYLTTVNYLGTLKYAWQEMKDPALAHIGIQRLAGAITGASTVAMVAYFRNKEQGIEEDEMEAWRRFLPDFWKNDIITITKNSGDGKAEYNNTSYMDYYGALTTPVVMLQRRFNANGTLKTEDIQDAAIEFSRNFIGWDILFGRVNNLIANQDDNQQKIYNPADDWDRQYRDMVAYMMESFEPGTVTDGKRIYRTWREGGEWQQQFKGTVTGSQSRTIDPMKSWQYYMLPDYKDQIENSRRIYTQQLRKYERLKTPGDMDKALLRDAKERADGAMNKILQEIVKDYDAAIKVGVPMTTVDEAIKSKKLRLDKDIRNAIFYRQPLMLLDDGQIVVKTK